MPKDHLVLEVKFTKIGNKVKYKLPVRMFCTDMNNEIPNTMTLDKNDGLIKAWIGDVDQAFKTKRVIYKKVIINYAYDRCDTPKTTSL